MVDVPPSTTAGYDDPISDEAADLLGRAGFARELATLAVASPYGWSTRIGVYGEWGEGKTSVVRLAQRYLEGEGHLTIEYNPWGCRNTDEMISILADQILVVAKKARLEVPGRAKRLAKKVGGFFGGAAKKADQLALPGPAAAAAPVISAAARFSPWLERWAKDRKEDIEKTLRVIDLDRRLVVFVDDVDRLDPKLLPSLLFALHEVFAIPGVTFVVALDPAVVGNALHEYHRGFGDGLAFLEKIVQFPRWLPPVAREDLLKVAEADRRLFTPFLSAGVLTDNRDLLPTNPRELRMLIRGLMPLQRAVSRHDSDELDQNLLLLLACFRQRFPLTLARLLDDETLLDRCSASFVASKAAPKFISSVVSLAVQTKELASEEMGDRADRFQRLVAAFCGRSIFWDAQRIRYHAFLTDRPHAVTWREFRTVIAAPQTAERTWTSGSRDTRCRSRLPPPPSRQSCSNAASGPTRTPWTSRPPFRPSKRKPIRFDTPARPPRCCGSSGSRRHSAQAFGRRSGSGRWSGRSDIGRTSI